MKPVEVDLERHEHTYRRVRATSLTQKDISRPTKMSTPSSESDRIMNAYRDATKDISLCWATKVEWVPLVARLETYRKVSPATRLLDDCVQKALKPFSNLPSEIVSMIACELSDMVYLDHIYEWQKRSLCLQAQCRVSDHYSADENFVIHQDWPVADWDVEMLLCTHFHTYGAAGCDACNRHGRKARAFKVALTDPAESSDLPGEDIYFSKAVMTRSEVCSEG